MRGIFADGPFKLNCCMMELKGKSIISDTEVYMLATNPFRGNVPIIAATPCSPDEPQAVKYYKQFNSDGSPQVNLVGDHLYSVKETK